MTMFNCVSVRLTVSLSVVNI